MNVAIIGAGIAGLATARDLAAHGIRSVLFEKSRGPGGRCATRRQGQFFWDSGATSVLPRGKSLETVMLNELPTTDLVRIDLPVAVHENLRVRAGAPNRGIGPRYVYQDGINTLAKLLATGLEIRTQVQVTDIQRDGNHFLVQEEWFDHVVITCPIPQAALLLWALDVSRPIANVRYRACISFLLGYEQPLPERPYFAILDPEQTHPLTSLSLESIKAPGRPSTLVAQMNRNFSRQNYDRPDAELIASVLSYVKELVGPDFEYPVATDVMRWKYSQPESFARFEDVNPPGTHVWLASDGLLGARIEDAFETGRRVASQIAS